ncbi:hypothetical protein PUMCH_000857 [Australozyma saopauloensis]|uniref:Bromo domain-containing protein n=1 Tax=Australozyma saopauloensis TaxID=291208 RepID=A0AAX4H5W0_9ASCO|nr:hypothetical protein PUMCH_000857 [[Candida] saopauloensis]
MGRRSRSPDSGDDLFSRSASKRRARAKVSYVEDSDDYDSSGEKKPKTNLDGVDTIQQDGEYEYGEFVPEKPADIGGLDDEYTDSEQQPVRLQRTRQKEKTRAGRSDDSDFKDESPLEQEEEELSEEYDDQGYLDRLREKQFIATDDENDGDDVYYKKKKLRLRKKSRSRSAEPRARKRAIGSDSEDDFGANDDVGDDAIQQEIQDLYDSSPEASPMKHKLREKKKRVDYTIPSLLTVDNEAELYAQAPTPQPLFLSRSKRPIGAKNAFRKLLYPTAGPFGGSDVQSILGQNIPPGGIPIVSNVPGGATTVASDGDSDSSDEDLVHMPLTIPGLTNSLKPAPIAAGGSSTVIGHTNVVGAQAVNKTKNNLSDTDPLGVDMNIDFSAVGGLDNYIDQLKEMVALPLLYPELYQNFLITPPRGVLFHGPPGTGKTLMARALAASCSTPTQKITFFMRKGADCLSKWVGEAERQLRLLFEEAKNQQPSIIFFDEIDGLAPVRSSKQEQIHASIVSTLLALMDGMDNRGQVIVIGATNRPDSVDPALRRPGRFDREFYFPLPDMNARKQILKIHTKKWTPPLSPIFIDKIAALTKGYGGADLRALCTEAALNSIQRKYPQIYLSTDKLMVNPSKVHVVAKDFIRAVEKIIPSSARSTSTGSSPLPQRLQPLLQDSLDKIQNRLSELLPGSVGINGRAKMTNLEEALYLDPTINDEDGGFHKHELLRNLESSRVCKPHLLICGEQGAGQQYLGAAILNLLEGFQVQNLDLASAFSDTTRTPELFIVQTFIEARRHQPSIIFISNIDTWFEVMPHSAKAILAGLLRNLRSNEKILLLGIADRNIDELDSEVKSVLGYSDGFNNIKLDNPSRQSRAKFFASVEKALFMKPYEFLNDLENRPKRKLKQLKIAPKKEDSDGSLTKRQIKEQEYQDKKLKNVLKIKLAGMLDLFKNRYKRFKKPIIDEGLLYHLFEPAVLENPVITYEVFYTKSTDPSHPNMIQELSTGNFFYNMDLDTIEERVWNGYYSEASQFLKDLNMIVKDSKTSGDRDRIVKAKEMLTNAQFAIEEINNPDFAKACREVRQREIKKQEKLVAQYKKLKEQMEANAEAESIVVEENGIEKNQIAEVGDAADSKENGALVANGVSEPKNSEVTTEVEPVAAPQPEPEAMAVDTNPVADPSLSTEASATQIIEIAPKVDEEDSESEAEEPLAVDTARQLVVPEDAYTLFEKSIVDATDGFTVEALEHVSAKLMEVIWEDRSKWDKTQTVERIRQVVAEARL